MGRVGAEKPSRNAEFRVELVELDLILNFALAAAAALSVASFAGLRRVFEAVFRAPRKTTVVVRRAGKTSELEISGSRVDIEEINRLVAQMDTEGQPVHSMTVDADITDHVDRSPATNRGAESSTTGEDNQ